MTVETQNDSLAALQRNLERAQKQQAHWAQTVEIITARIALSNGEMRIEQPMPDVTIDAQAAEV